MKIIHSEDHRYHFPQGEISGGQFVTPFERPSRVEYILARLRDRGMTDISAPGPLDMAPVRAIHDAGFLEFLETCWAEWIAEGYKGEILPLGFPARRMQARRPNHVTEQRHKLDRDWLVAVAVNKERPNRCCDFVDVQHVVIGRSSGDVRVERAGFLGRHRQLASVQRSLVVR